MQHEDADQAREALTRSLAVAGRRAVELCRSRSRSRREDGLLMGQLAAMALASIGRLDDAAQVQQETRAAVAQAR